MPVFRTHPRSSDPIDFEHTATMKEMEELTLAEKEHGTPEDHFAHVERPAVSFYASSPDTQTRTVPDHPAGISRRTERALRWSGGEKIQVFKDGGPAIPADSNAKENGMIEQVAGVKTKSSGSKHSRSISDLVIGQANITLKVAKKSASIASRSATDDSNPESFTNESLLTHGVQQLQTIATRRARLLDELRMLQEEENDILRQLTSTIHATPLPNSPKSTSGTSSHSPVPHKPTIPRTPLPRPVSAPPKSSPAPTRNHALNRVPLADKTDDIAECDSTGFFLPVQLTTPAYKKDFDRIATRDISSLRNGRTMRVPINLGDDGPSGGEMRGGEKACGVGGRVVGDRSRGRSGGSRTRSSRSSTPVATPGTARFYGVPKTVARKRWEF